MTYEGGGYYKFSKVKYTRQKVSSAVPAVGEEDCRMVEGDTTNDMYIQVRVMYTYQTASSVLEVGVVLSFFTSDFLQIKHNISSKRCRIGLKKTRRIIGVGMSDNMSKMPSA